MAQHAFDPLGGGGPKKKKKTATTETKESARISEITEDDDPLSAHNIGFTWKHDTNVHLRAVHRPKQNGETRTKVEERIVLRPAIPV